MLTSLRTRLLFALLLAVPLPLSSLSADEFPAAFNTDPPDSHPPAPEEMVDLIDVPDGFQVTLFASEPEVRQPINMEFDDRGRLWVAENYTYSGGPYETKLRDRIVILADTDGDGRHDTRKVFWDQGFMLTSLTWGFGGVWILNDGTLSFIPDRNGDDVPDSEPVVMLDGWSKNCGHNFVSGLMWGPDGWLYGRHGIVDTSYPGRPGTPREERVFMNCGIWRFHPTRHVVEVVCNGTTNPWGLDYNRDNQFFMTNNVQGHLWHVIPGAHYQRMYGRDFNPHAYELMEMTADHYHWDNNLRWTDSRDGKANDLGGGHSHVGGLIYHGDNFPSAYRDMIFMCNTHGRRVNVNRLDRSGSGYVGKREPDFMLVRTPWFRGVDLKQGPEGAIYVSDWSDNGECHDHDGIHRTSGRIYRITYGQPVQPDIAAIRRSGDFGDNGWFSRRSIRWQQEAGEAASAAVDAAQLTVHDLGRIEAAGGLSNAVLTAGLDSANPLTLAAAIHLAAAEADLRTQHVDRLIKLAQQDQPGSVLLALVSVLQKMEPPHRAELTHAILSHTGNLHTITAEKQLTLMTWYGIEPVTISQNLLPLLGDSETLQGFAARRMAHEVTADPQLAGQALAWIGSLAAADPKASTRLLQAFRSGLAGFVRLDPPAEWKTAETALRKSADRSLQVETDALAVLFGSGAALADVRLLAADAAADPLSRQQAVRTLAQSRDTESVELLIRLLSDKITTDTAIIALSAFDDKSIAPALLGRLGGFRYGNRGLAIDTLSSRREWAEQLLKAVAEGRLNASELTAGQVRQLLAFEEDSFRQIIEQHWGIIKATPEARVAAIEQWKEFLTPETVAAGDPQHGAEIFRKSCASCHRLFGDGKQIAPDLTGANRTNLDYLLINIVDPSAVVPRQYTTSVIALTDGRIVTGAVVSSTDQSVVVQTDRDVVTIARENIEDSRDTGLSLMPEGLLDKLSREEVRDLMHWMMLGP